MQPDVSLVCSRVRVEEKMLLDAFDRRGVDVRRYDERDLMLDFHRPERLPLMHSRVVMLRPIAHSRARRRGTP